MRELNSQLVMQLYLDSRMKLEIKELVVFTWLDMVSHYFSLF
jgi:hypothetical protein